MSSFDSVTVVLSLVTLAALLLYIFRRHRGCPTYSAHPLFSSVCSAIYAGYKLGTDETAFLRHLQQTYGDIVYLPFPYQSTWCFRTQ